MREIWNSVGSLTASRMEGNVPHAERSGASRANVGEGGGSDAPSEKEVGKATNPVLVSLDYMDLGEDSRESAGFSETPEAHPALKSLVSADYGEDSSGSSASIQEVQAGDRPNPVSQSQSNTGPGSGKMSMSMSSDCLESGDGGKSAYAEEQSSDMSLQSVEVGVPGGNMPGPGQVVQPPQERGKSNIAATFTPVGTAGMSGNGSHSHFPEFGKRDQPGEAAVEVGVPGGNMPGPSRVVQLLQERGPANIAATFSPVGTAELAGNGNHSYLPEFGKCDLPGDAAIEEELLGTPSSTLAEVGSDAGDGPASDSTDGRQAPGPEQLCEFPGVDDIANIPLPAGPPPPLPPPAAAAGSGPGKTTVGSKPNEREHVPHTLPQLPPEAEGLPPRVVSILLQGQEHHHTHSTPSRPASFEPSESKHTAVAPAPAGVYPVEPQRKEAIEESKEKNEEEPMEWDEASTEAGKTEEAIPGTKGTQAEQEGFDQAEESNFDLPLDNESQPSNMETSQFKTDVPPFQAENVPRTVVGDVPVTLSGPVLTFPSERDNSNIPPCELKTPEGSTDAPLQDQTPKALRPANEPMEEGNAFHKENFSWSRSDVAQLSGGTPFKCLEESQASSSSQGFSPENKAAKVLFPSINVPSTDSQPENSATDTAPAAAAAPAHDFAADIRAAIHPAPSELQEGGGEDPNNPSSSQFLEDDSMAARSLLQDEESMLAGDSSLCPDEESRVTADSSSLCPGEDSVVGEESMSLGGDQEELRRKRKLTYDSVLGVDEESQAAEDVHFPGLTAEGTAEGPTEDAPPSAKRPRHDGPQEDGASNSVQIPEQAVAQSAEVVEGVPVFPPENLFEYQWPQDGGEWHMLQEQISEYLGILSFKRKYPDLTRRTVEKQEKEFLREKGVVSETQCDLGLTALRSEEVYDLMHKDYAEKYQEYANVLHEREKQTIKEQHKEYEVPKLEKSKMAAYIKKAAKSAAEFNLQLQRERKEDRRAFFDLQTFTIQYPKGRHKILPPEKTNYGAYPVSLLPGQYQNYTAYYTSDELRYLPLNTVMYDPPKRMQNKLANPAQIAPAESSEEADSAEDKNGSASASDSDGSGSSDSEDSGLEAEEGPGEQQAEDAKPEEVKCRVCAEASKKGKDGKVEILVKCSECNTHGHPTCLDLPKKMVDIITTYPWQCMECKTCIECMDPYDEDKMMFCDRCDRGYHTFCVGLRSIPTGRWECKSCKGSTSSASARARASSRRSRH